MVDAMKVKRSIYFATLQGYVIFETELYMYSYFFRILYWHVNEAYWGILDYGILAYFFKGYWDICVFILGYGIFTNFGIWDIGIYFGKRVKLILGYGIFWTVYFGIWDIAYPPYQASLMSMT